MKMTIKSWGGERAVAATGTGLTAFQGVRSSKPGPLLNFSDSQTEANEHFQVILRPRTDRGLPNQWLTVTGGALAWFPEVRYPSRATRQLTLIARPSGADRTRCPSLPHRFRIWLHRQGQPLPPTCRTNRFALPCSGRVSRIASVVRHQAPADCGSVTPERVKRRVLVVPVLQA